MPEPTPRAVSEALRRLLEDPELRERLGRAGIETAQEYAWERRIDALEGFLGEVATPRRLTLEANASAQSAVQ
jgi:glycosyltransferase involved in cell wall biosynthesis